MNVTDKGFPERDWANDGTKPAPFWQAVEFLEYAKHRHPHGTYGNACIAISLLLKSQATRIQELEGALEDFGQHKPDCVYFESTNPCDCGLEAALAGKGEG